MIIRQNSIVTKCHWVSVYAILRYTCSITDTDNSLFVNIANHIIYIYIKYQGNYFDCLINWFSRHFILFRSLYISLLVNTASVMLLLEHISYIYTRIAWKVLKLKNSYDDFISPIDDFWSTGSKCCNTDEKKSGPHGGLFCNFEVFHAVIWYQVIPPNTNNLQTEIFDLQMGS